VSKLSCAIAQGILLVFAAKSFFLGRGGLVTFIINVKNLRMRVKGNLFTSIKCRYEYI
jgi:hypothetical protein